MNRQLISDKVYAYINNKGEIIKKSKGINNNLLTLEDFKSLNDGISITKKKSTIFKKDLKIIRLIYLKPIIKSKVKN